MKGKGKIAAALLTACLLSAEAAAHEDYGEQLEGIVIDATMNSVSVVTAQGELLTFPVPEEISLADGLMLGTPVSVRLENGRTALQNRGRSGKPWPSLAASASWRRTGACRA